MKKLKLADKVMISITVLTVILTLFVISPFSNKYGSMAVMRIYSSICAKEGIPQVDGLTLDIPGGDSTRKSDWFPFVMTYVPGEDFGRTMGRDCFLTILYNFPDFDMQKGCSRLYDEQSPFYSSFYGAYLVKTEDDEKYGFACDRDGHITGVNPDELAAVAKYDYQNLVLSDFGLSQENAVFSFVLTQEEKNLSYVGYDGWYMADAVLTVNGCAHSREDFVASYLQYGIPNFPVDRPLKATTMYGRMYGKYIEEKKVSIFFYIIAADQTVLEECDMQILSKSKLDF